MKLLKRMAILSLCVIAVSGCTKSSISTQGPVAQQTVAGMENSGVEEMDPEKLAALDEEEIEKIQLIEEETEEATLFDAEQVADECEELFGDSDFYPESVNMDYVLDEAAQTIELTWVLKNGTTEEAAMGYATELVQKFNDVLAVQVADVEFSSAESFGGIWEQFALNVKVGTEDGTWLIEKDYAAGAEIDLELPEITGDGPMSSEKETEERISPSAKN